MAEVNHQTNTLSFISVPSHTRLFHRDGGTYYLRAKVPKKIRDIIGKTEIRKSLWTKDLKARQKVKIESVRVDALFSAAEAKLNRRPAPVHICPTTRSIGGSVSIFLNWNGSPGG